MLESRSHALILGIVLLGGTCLLVSLAACEIVQHFDLLQGDLCSEGTIVQNPRDDRRNLTSPTAEVRYLGNPFKTWRDIFASHRYARNVWDMQLWGDKIYLGHGNSSNRGPAPNAGPVRVIAYHPQSGCFQTEFIVDEEQIDRYRVIGNQLYIPGHDPREPWDWGNFYRLTNDGWEKVRTIPQGIHAYDILGYQGALFVALGTTEGGKVARSTDGGQTWESFALPGVGRAFELFTLGNELYVHAYRNGGLYRYSKKSFDRLAVDLFPSAQYSQNPMMVRSILFDGVLLYIGADNVNDHQWTPFAAYKAESINEAQKLNLPPQDLPYDILVRDGNGYILTNRFEDSGSGYTVIIYRSDDVSGDLEQWKEIVRFNAPSFARSFELYEGVFYIGLGTATKPLNAASGNIYQVVPPVP